MEVWMDTQEFLCIYTALTTTKLTLYLIYLKKQFRSMGFLLESVVIKVEKMLMYPCIC